MKNTQNLFWTDLGEGYVKLTLNMAGKSVNVLNSEIVHELTEAFTSLQNQIDVRGLLFTSGKPKQFIAGANIDEIFELTDAADAAEKAGYGQEMMALLQSLPFPTVAVIDGPALGGGLELSLAATYRVAAIEPYVKLSLPETQLGIIPGWGGTQRLPVLVGLGQALTLITSGKSLNGTQAFKIGLVDDIAPSSILETVALKLLKKKPALPKLRKLSGTTKILEALPPYRAFIFAMARKMILKQTHGFYPAPIEAVDVLQKTFKRGGQFGYEIEAKAVGKLIVSPVTKSLLQLFRWTEDVKKMKSDHTAKDADKNIGVLGAGIMGGGIAYLLASKEKQVRIKDMNAPALLKALQTAFDLLKKQVQRKKLSAAQSREVLNRISPTTTYAGFEKSNIVIEAVVENIDVKKQVFKDLSEVVSPSAILATNTSALSITEIATAAKNPERVVGLHFFNPVHKMPLVEIIKGDQSSAAAVQKMLDLAISLGKTPIVVKDRPGFLVNRILGLYLNEALVLLGEGVSIQSLEKAMKKFGMPMGPCELMDEVGLDVAHKVGVYLSAQLPHFPKTAPLFEKIVASKKLGKKSGRGFYVHTPKKRPELDLPFLSSIGVKIQDTGADDQIIVERLVYLMINEAYRCLEEKIVESERDVDLGMVLGTGFAPFRGGLMSYASSVGLPKIREKLIEFSSKHGAHYTPCALMISST